MTSSNAELAETKISNFRSTPMVMLDHGLVAMERIWWIASMARATGFFVVLDKLACAESRAVTKDQE